MYGQFVRNVGISKLSSWKDKVPREYSKPHREVMEIVKELGLSFITEEPVRLDSLEFSVCVPDIIIDGCEKGKLIILVHGLKWHKGETKSRHDEQKAKLLRDMGFKVIKFWDYQIKKKKYAWIKEEIMRAYNETFEEHMKRVGSDLVLI
ncbi:hypothetical protein ES705_46946 [subsurface metagenome]